MSLKIAIAVLVLFVALGILKRVLSAKPAGSARFRYKRIDLFNSTEHAFLLALRREAPSHVAVLAKVRVADLLSTIGNDIPAFNRIARKHVDFVLYNLQNRSVLRAIELDGPTHSSSRAVKSDNVKNSCFASARIPLARVPVAECNKPDVIRSLFEPSPDLEGAYDARRGQRHASIASNGPAKDIDAAQGATQPASRAASRNGRRQ
jgi:hypothetical protein